MIRRKKGERLPKGFIKKEILSILIRKFPNSVDEPEIREFLSEKWNIRESKGVKNHLADLKLENILIKESSSGKVNLWQVNTDYNTFEKIAENFLHSAEKFYFVKTPYVHEMINVRFLNHFLKQWNTLEIRLTDFTEILKNSPSALKIVCFDLKRLEELEDLKSRLRLLIFTSFINDMLLTDLSEGKRLYTEFKLKFSETYEEEGEIKERGIFNFTESLQL